MGCDHQLQCCTGHGLIYFMPVSLDVRPICSRPYLAWLLDKGSDGFCSVWWMVYEKKIRGAPFFDPMHVPYRDLDTWLDDQGLKASMKLKSIHHNFTFGPWDGESWLQQHKDTAKEASAMEAVDDACLDYWWYKICLELEIDYWSSTKADRLRFLRSLPTEEWLNKNGPRCCASRWGTYAKAEEYRSHFEARRGFLLMVQGVLQHWLGNQKAKTMITEGLQPTANERSGRDTTKNAKAAVNKARDRSTNTAQLVLFVLMDQKIQRDNSILFYLCKIVDHAHSVLCKELKSVEKVREYYVQMCFYNTKYIRTVSTALFPFTHFEALQKIGFDCEFHHSSLQGLTLDSNEIQAELELAGVFFNKIIPGVGKLIRGHMTHAWTYPGKFQLCNSKDREVVNAGLQAVHDDYDAWVAVQQCGGLFWTKFTKRMSWNWTIVQETALLLQNTNFQMTDEFQCQLDRLHSHTGGTYSVECLFQKAADHCDRDNSNRRLDGKALWMIPVAEKMLEKIFDFRQVSTDEIVPDMVPATNAEAQLPDDFFSCKLKDCTLDLKGLVSTSASASWQTFSGATYWMLASDQFTVSFLHKSGKLNHGADTWRAFAVPPGLLIDIGGSVYFSLLQWATVVLLIRAEHTIANDGKSLWRFKEVGPDTVVVRPIYTFDDMKLLPVQWLSPKALSICLGHIPAVWGQQYVCRQYSTALPFLQGAAKACFWQLPIKALKKLAKDEYKLQLAGSEVDSLVQLISHVLPGIKDDDMAKILELRYSCHVCVCVCFYVVNLVFLV